jgi:hypothetical protein
MHQFGEDHPDLDRLAQTHSVGEQKTGTHLLEGLLDRLHLVGERTKGTDATDIGVSGCQRHLPQLGFEEQLGPLKTLAAVADKSGVSGVNRNDRIKVGHEGGFVSPDHFVCAGAKRDLRARGEIEAANTGDKPFSIAAKNAHARRKQGGKG